MAKKNVLKDYIPLLDSIKTRIRRTQVRAMLSANAEMLLLYWDVGRIVSERQTVEGWGAGVIPRLAADIKNDLPEIKGFSERNMDRMIRFYKDYPLLGALVPRESAESSPKTSISPPPVAKLSNASREHSISLPHVAQLGTADEIRIQVFQEFALLLPWAHHVVLMEKVKDVSIRLWYMKESVGQGWTRDTLAMMIKKDTYNRQGKAITNFSLKLPPTESELAQQILRDPYIFDFLTLEEPFRERELENALAENLGKFLLELGHGFAFVGRQYHLEVSDHDFYLDLLFYHLDLRRFIVIDLKKGKFQPEYAGKVNFYCSAVDDLLRRPGDATTIGLILCQEKDKIIAEYSLRNMEKPIGVSEYELTRKLPELFRSALPSIEQIETELAERLGGKTTKNVPRKKKKAME
jgi:predicted nuclease of restriction endonuclease-like (RecB) superfamily